MKFELTDDEVMRVQLWKREVDATLIAEGADGMQIQGGAAGGRLTYSFSPTHIGTVITVRDSASGKELDLTDYDSW